VEPGGYTGPRGPSVLTDWKVEARVRDLRWLLDYIDIRTVSARLNRFADAGDGEGSASLFTEDGTFELSDHRAYRGRRAVEAVTGATDEVIHLTTDPILEITGDSARQISRMVTLRGSTPSGAELVATGTYTDDLRRVEGEWKFHYRRVDVDQDVDEVLSRLGIDNYLTGLRETHPVEGL